MIVLGITGNIGSGKSLCCDYIRKKYDAYFLSTDIISKMIVSSNEEFSFLNNVKNSFLTKDEQNIVIKKLHPKVWKAVKELINYIKKTTFFEKTKIILIETALPNKIFFDICDKTILIKNELHKKSSFLKKNRKYSEEKINAILSSQKKYVKYYEKCNYIVYNNSTKTSLKNKIFNLINEEIL